MKNIFLGILMLFHISSYSNLIICYKGNNILNNGQTVCENYITSLKCNDAFVLDQLGENLPQGWTCSNSKLIIKNPKAAIYIDSLGNGYVLDNGEKIHIASDALNKKLTELMDLAKQKKITSAELKNQLNDFIRNDKSKPSLKYIRKLSNELHIKIIYQENKK